MLRLPSSPTRARRVSLLGSGLVVATTLLSGTPAAGALPRSASRRSAAALRGTVNGRAPGYLGIEFHDLTDDQMKPLRLAAGRGVEVIMVDHDGPAGKAGLRPHDVIVSLNGQALAGAEALRRLIHDAGAGMQIALTVIRGGHPVTLNAQLADRVEVDRAAAARLAAADATEASPAPAQSAVAFGFADAPPVEAPPAPPDATPPPPSAPATPAPGSGFIGHIVHGSIYTGAVLDTMEPQLASFFGAPLGTGLLVHSVSPGSPAAVAGLHAGDILLRADFYTLRTTADWTKRLHAAKGRPITLSILRDKREMTLSLQQDLKHHSLVEWPTLF